MTTVAAEAPSGAIDWRPWDGSGVIPDCRTYLVWCTRPDPTGLGLGPTSEVCRAYLAYDHEHPRPHPCGVGSELPLVWQHHPSGRRFADDVTVTHWAPFNRPGEASGHVT